MRQHEQLPCGLLHERRWLTFARECQDNCLKQMGRKGVNLGQFPPQIEQKGQNYLRKSARDDHFTISPYCGVIVSAPGHVP